MPKIESPDKDVLFVMIFATNFSSIYQYKKASINAIDVVVSSGALWLKVGLFEFDWI